LVLNLTDGFTFFISLIRPVATGKKWQERIGGQNFFQKERFCMRSEKILVVEKLRGGKQIISTKFSLSADMTRTTLAVPFITMLIFAFGHLSDSQHVRS